MPYTDEGVEESTTSLLLEGLLVAAGHMRLRVDVLSTEARIFQKKKIEEGDTCSKKKKRSITLLEVFITTSR